MKNLWKNAKWHSQRVFHRALTQILRTLHERKRPMIQIVLSKTSKQHTHTHIYINRNILYRYVSYAFFGKSQCSFA